ncbi:MAG: tetraacyldisaccharide 4'-kinase [Prevotellaceae bacterium]|jgi:tetraacyldisaccharide 4'-kinase|nr:tetraacyldisaccharide 4'-kinase [Prevotellaceae bacterium]
MNTKSTVINMLLFPFSILYGAVVFVRNWLFNAGVLRTHRFDIPVISVGNITVGGTGKTPFTEYLVQLLQSKKSVGVLSRGYKRKSRGYVLASQNSSPLEIGDEPCQIKNKFPKAIVAVDKNRVEGIRKMLKEKESQPDVIILDDAFQYRYIDPDVSILLIDYNRPVMEDHLLPLGQLREPVKSKNRAHIVVVTKCPPDIKPMDMRIMTKKLNLYPYQTLYFTTLAYGQPVPVFPQKIKQKTDLRGKKGFAALALSAIASPSPFEAYLREHIEEVVPLRFFDHHHFTRKDMAVIEKKFNHISNPNKLIITTEKDAMRIRSHPGFPKSLKNKIYYIPLSIRFLQEQEKSFDKKIYDYVGRRKQGAHLF